MWYCQESWVKEDKTFSVVSVSFGFSQVRIRKIRCCCCLFVCWSLNVPATCLCISFFLSLLYLFVCLLVGCLTSQQHASVSQGRICSDNFTCCHTEVEAADPTFYLTQSQYTDTGSTSPSADPISPGAWQSSHWSANF